MRIDVAVIAAIIGLIGVVVGSLLGGRSEQNQWLREKREESYFNLLKYLIRVRNKRSRLEGDRRVLTEEHQKELFDELAEIKTWAIMVWLYSSPSLKRDAKEIEDEATKLICSLVDEKDKENGTFKDKNEDKLIRVIELFEFDSLFNKIESLARRQFNRPSGILGWRL